jgi:hypothetical protein
MVGSWPCKVSPEIHINRRCVSEPVREDKGKITASEPEDRKDLKRAHVVLSKGHEDRQEGPEESTCSTSPTSWLPFHRAGARQKGLSRDLCIGRS